ncbi:MAG: sulfotransferase [Actinomycetota bacterium]|nr:sulfotransferase [Actinomycetota bacterium]
MLRIIFNAHSQVAVPPESRFVTELWTGSPDIEVDDFMARLAAHRQFRNWELDLDAVRAEMPGGPRVHYRAAVEAAYLAYAKRNGKSRWGDKTPRYVEKIPFLADLWPEAAFVHLVRDGRNVALSYAKVPFGPKTVPKVAVLWSQRVTTGARDGRRLGPERYIEVRYEDFVEDPEGCVKKLCSMLDLTFEPSMLEYSEVVEKMVFAKASTYNPHVFEPPRPGVRTWQSEMTDPQVRLFEAIAGGALEMFGYPRRYSRLGPATKLAASLGRMGIPIGRLRKEG